MAHPPFGWRCVAASALLAGSISMVPAGSLADARSLLAEAIGDIRSTARLRPLQLRRKAATLEEGEVRLRPVGGVGPDRARRVRWIEDCAELAAVMNASALSRG